MPFEVDSPAAVAQVENEAAKRGAALPEAKTDPQADRLRQLAELPLVEYDRVRKVEAERLGIRIGTLDSEVARLRPASRKTESETLLLSESEPWPEPVLVEELLDDLLEITRRYVVMDEPARVAVCLWFLHSYCFDTGNVSPILAILSPEKRCGKTTLLELLTALVLRPLPTANLTSPVVFRVIESHRPTLLIDEADTFIRNSDELRGVLNSGHRRATASVLRTVGENHEVKVFSTWCPKAMAAIGQLPETLQDRSIVISLRRRAVNEKVEHFRFDRLVAALKPTRRMAVRWAADNHDALKIADPEIPSGLDDRAVDNWRPLLAIAEAASSKWALMTRRAAVKLCACRETDDESARTVLLADIYEYFSEGDGDRVTSADLAAWLGRREERPWPEWKNGKPITPRQVARLLKPFGISPSTTRFGPTTAKGYDSSQFQDAFLRYVPGSSVTASQPNKDGAFSDFQSVTCDRPVTDDNSIKTNSHSGCDGVTDEPREGGRREVSATAPLINPLAAGRRGTVSQSGGRGGT